MKISKQKHIHNNFSKLSKLTHCKKYILKLKRLLFATTLEDSSYREENKKEIKKQIEKPIKFGLLAVLISLILFVVWAGIAPLDSAATAEGYIKLNENRKIIQHHEGGIVEKILIKDGDKVNKGDILVIMNRSKTHSELLKTLWEINYSTLVEQRIEQLLYMLIKLRNNEVINSKEVHFIMNNELLLDTNNLSYKDLEKLLKTQEDLFNIIKKSIYSKITVYLSQLEQVDSEIEIHKNRIENYEKLFNISRQELNRRRHLLKNETETLDNIAREEKDTYNLEYSILETKIKLRGLKSKKSEIKSSFTNFLDQETIKLADEFKRNKKELLHHKSSYIQVKDAYERSIIRASYSGIINDLKIHTIGASIPYNYKLMEIIPQDDDLVIEAFVKSNEIDNVKVGKKVKIQLSAFKTRTTPRIEGTVLSVSADKFDKEIHNHRSLTPIGFYKVIVDIPKKEINKINSIIELTPGMPVVIFIIKGTRTLAGYLYSPIRDSFHKAFKES